MDPTSATSDLYEFKMALFDNKEPEEFLLFVWNFNMVLAESGTLTTGAKMKYIYTLVCREALRQFDSLSADMEGMNLINVKTIILGLALYYFLWIYYQRKGAQCAAERVSRAV